VNTSDIFRNEFVQVIDSNPSILYGMFTAKTNQTKIIIRLTEGNLTWVKFKGWNRHGILILYNILKGHIK
jgi:hypothetical protein